MGDQTLTSRQIETLQKIESYVYSKGYSPTLTELKLLLNVSSNQAVINHLDALEKKGFILREKGARGLKVIKTTVPDTGNQFVDILSRIATSKRIRNQSGKPRMLFSNPYAVGSTPGQVIYGKLDDERY